MDKKYSDNENSELNEITEQDVVQGNYLELLNGVQSKLFPGLNLKIGLFNEAWYCQKFSIRQVFDMLIHALLIDQYRVLSEISNNNILTIYTKNYRDDHDGYWEHIKKSIGEHDEVTIVTNKKHIIKKIHICRIIKRFFWLITALRELGNRFDKKDRLYLAIRIVERKQTLDDIEKLNLSPKAVMCFFDSAPNESILMQYFKNKGAVTLTNQHGQPVFRNPKIDRLNQSQILNFSSDYFLAKGEYTKRQFERAGVSSNKIRIVGSAVPTLSLDYKQNNTKLFGVFLDTPAYEFALKTNREVLKFAENISEKIGYKYVIKLHPSDMVDNYSDIKMNYCKNVFAPKSKLQDAFENIEFGIFNASSVYVDMLLNRIKSYQVKTEIDFPIVESDLDIVYSIEDFCIKHEKWSVLKAEEKSYYIEKTIRTYIDGTDYNIRIRDFLKEINAI